MNTSHSADDECDTLREMSHAMRTPLTSLLGFSGLLLEDEGIVGERREYLAIINDEARRLTEMLDHYVALLRTERERAHSP